MTPLGEKATHPSWGRWGVATFDATIQISMELCDVICELERKVCIVVQCDWAIITSNWTPKEWNSQQLNEKANDVK